MKAVLKSVCLLVMAAGCEAEAPAASHLARAELAEAAERTDEALEEQGDAAEAPACRRAERVLYACDFGDRQVAVCATDERVSYRFGDSRRTDLEIDSRPGRVKAHATRLKGAGGEQAQIRFTNNDWQYVVHSSVAGAATEAEGRRASGLVVLRDGVVRDRRTCRQTGPAQAVVAPSHAAIAAEAEAAYATWW